MNDSAARHEWLRSEVRVALGRLAAPAEDQLASLRRTDEGVPVDELALSLDDVAEAAATAEALLTVGQRRLLKDVVDQLTMMSGPDHEDLWTATALQNADEWHQVRKLADRALAAIERRG